MRLILASAIAVGLIAGTPVVAKPVWVDGYCTVLRGCIPGYWKTEADDSYNNNYSTSPNTNPFTGKSGTNSPTYDDRPPPKLEYDDPNLLANRRTYEARPSYTYVPAPVEPYQPPTWQQLWLHVWQQQRGPLQLRQQRGITSLWAAQLPQRLWRRRAVRLRQQWRGVLRPRLRGPADIRRRCARQFRLPEAEDVRRGTDPQLRRVGLLLTVR